jgi:hypothetical protein
MATKIICAYELTVSGNQSQASLAARFAAVPLDLSLPQMWGLIPIEDVTTEPTAKEILRTITLHFDNAGATLTPVQDTDPLHGGIDSLTLGATSGYFAGPPVITISPSPIPGGKPAAAVAIMGVTEAIVANGGSGYTGASVATLVGGNLAPGGTPATLGPIALIGGVVSSIAIATPGSGYTTFPTIVITDSGGGSGAEVYGGLQIVGTTMTAHGSLYSSLPTITVTALFNASVPGEMAETTDATMANWMTGQLQIATRSPINAFVPQFA